ncbi:MAG: Dabb family protein [Rhizobiaceae bacterium]
MIRHLVALRYRDSTSQETKDQLMKDLAGLSGHIDGIVDFQVRDNVSVEDHLVRDFRHLFWFDFTDSAVRDAYLVDAAHQAIGARIVAETEGGPDGVYVFDFEV